MLMPMGPMGVEEMAPPPTVVKETYARWWWAYLFLVVASSVGEILSHDVFGVLLAILISFIVWYMVKDDCLRMSQYCVFMFGFMCGIQCIFDTIMLVVSVGGRRTQRVTRKPITDTQMSYTTIIETHPFFDDSQGFTYNAQSWMMIVSTCLMLLGALLAWRTYSAFPTGLFAQGEGEPIMGGGGGDRFHGGGGGGGYGGGPAGGAPFGRGGGGAPGGGGQAQGAQGPGGFRAFEGPGQRLGANG